ncbi:MAG: hypothetical protein ACAH11_13725 [Sphingomonas sp.]
MTRLPSLPLLLPLLLFAAPAAAQGSDPCADPATACRMLERVKLEEADGTVRYVATNINLPYVVKGNVVITPGESVTIALVKEGNDLVPKLVRFGPASASTKPGEGEIRFTLSPSKRGKVTLTVESRHAGPLDYAALIATDPGGGNRTSVCTLTPGVPVIEVWEQPVYQFAAWHFIPSVDPGCKTLKWAPPERYKR